MCFFCSFFSPRIRIKYLSLRSEIYCKNETELNKAYRPSFFFDARRTKGGSLVKVDHVSLDPRTDRGTPHIRARNPLDNDRGFLVLGGRRECPSSKLIVCRSTLGLVESRHTHALKTHWTKTALRSLVPKCVP